MQVLNCNSEVSQGSIHGCLQKSEEFAPVDYASPPYPSTLHITTDFANFMAESSSIPNRSSRETWIKEERPSIKVVLPTSMEAERVLSVTGLFLTKLRTRLSKKKLSAS